MHQHYEELKIHVTSLEVNMCLTINFSCVVKRKILCVFKERSSTEELAVFESGS